MDDLESTTMFPFDSEGERAAIAAADAAADADEPVQLKVVAVVPCNRLAVKDTMADKPESTTDDALPDAEDTTEETATLIASEDEPAPAAVNQIVMDGPVNVTKVDVSNDYEDWLKNVEFTTPAVEYFDVEEEEGDVTTTRTESADDATEATTDWPSTDWPTTDWPSTDWPSPSVDSRQNLFASLVAAAASASTSAKKKRSYQGYRVYRVILPTEESVARILALEGEPGIEFWADPHLLLRPRGLFVTSAADILTSPQAVPLIERVFRESRAPFSVLVPNVQVIARCNYTSLYVVSCPVLSCRRLPFHL